MGIFRYEFIQNAFFVGTIIALVVPLVGSVMVFKRMSMIGETLSHVSMAGVVIGLIMGFNPIYGAIVMSVFAALSVEVVRKRLKSYNELALTVIASAGVGLTGVLLGFLKTSANINSFLFGSILTITNDEKMLALFFGVAVILISSLFYRHFFLISFDETTAALSGINVNRTNLLFTIMTAVTVSVTSRIVGALIVSSLMVVPIAISMQISKSYKQTIGYGVLFSVLSVWGGLLLAALSPYGLKPGGTIVLCSVAFLIIVLIIKSIQSKIKH